MASQFINYNAVHYFFPGCEKPTAVFSSARLRLIVLLAMISAGCAAPITLSVRETFYRLRPELSRPWDSIVLDSIRILRLLDDYRFALEQGDRNKLFDLFSPDYSREGKGRDWWLEREEEELFRRFGRLEVEVEEIETYFTFDRLLPRLRRESFDWLAGPEASHPFPRSYLLKITMDSNSLVLKLPGEEKEAGRTNPDAEPAIPVAVTTEVDPDIPAPHARLSFNISLSGEFASPAGAGSFAYRLRERRVLVLRKEEAGWKIISQY